MYVAAADPRAKIAIPPRTINEAVSTKRRPAVAPPKSADPDIAAMFASRRTSVGEDMRHVIIAAARNPSPNAAPPTMDQIKPAQSRNGLLPSHGTQREGDDDQCGGSEKGTCCDGDGEVDERITEGRSHIPSLSLVWNVLTRTCAG